MVFAYPQSLSAKFSAWAAEPLLLITAASLRFRIHPITTIFDASGSFDRLASLGFFPRRVYFAFSTAPRALRFRLASFLLKLSLRTRSLCNLAFSTSSFEGV